MCGGEYYELITHPVIGRENELGPALQREIGVAGDEGHANRGFGIGLCAELDTEGIGGTLGHAEFRDAGFDLCGVGRLRVAQFENPQKPFA